MPPTHTEQKAKAVAQPDELIDFHHLKMRKGLSKVEVEDSVASDLARATGLADAAAAASNRLNKIVQLTGFSDPIYAEAYVTVHQYDIVLDVNVINRTNETMQVRGQGGRGRRHMAAPHCRPHPSGSTATAL
jgi:coatomer subunit beta